MVIADPHVLASSLCDPTSQSCKDMMKSQRKMIDLSEKAWYALIDTIQAYCPSLVLIPGDLTKDSELASHTVVAKSLRKLEEQGIKTLVIPGNHDIGGAAYSYTGDTKVAVDSLKDTQWESAYSWIYQGAVAKDTKSHSYVSEPLDGVTVIGIDGSHKSAGTGSLDKSTLKWILQQADAAKAKGNMVLAMCHWQLLEDFDQKGTLESSCRLKNADAIRDSLMHHGVRMVFTGHFHVDAITTYRDTTGRTNDSIIEVSTGSPITYPCPYRWLTISGDRSTVSIETETLTSLDTIADLYTYSRAWMKEHTENLIPVMVKRVLAYKDQAYDELRAQYGSIAGEAMIKLIDMSLPSTEEGYVNLFKRHMGNTVIELYLVHSDGNEPEHPEADSLKNEVYKGIDGMIDEVASGWMWNTSTGKSTKAMIKTEAALRVEVPLNSLVADRTHYQSQRLSDRTDDLCLVACISEPRQATDIDNNQSPITNHQLYDILGRLVTRPVPGQIYIQNGKKIILW